MTLIYETEATHGGWGGGAGWSGVAVRSMVATCEGRQGQEPGVGVEGKGTGVGRVGEA